MSSNKFEASAGSRLSHVRFGRRTMIAGALATAAIVRPRLAWASDGEIRIGVSAPLTAQFAQDGQWMRNGIELAVKEINAASGVHGQMLKLYIEDDQGPNPTAAVNAVTKLITEYNVAALIGPHFTPAILPVEPMLEQYKVPALTGATGPVVTQQHNPYVFRVRLNDAVGALLLVQYVVRTLGWKRIGLCYVNTAFGQSAATVIRKALADNKMAPVVEQTHLDSTKDFTSQLLSFQDAKVDGVIAWTDDQPGGLLAKQRHTLGLKFGMAGSTTFSQPPFLALAGNAADGIYSITDFTADSDTPSIIKWKELYHNAYGQTPELYASAYYDATHLLATAIANSATPTGPDIQAALTKITNQPGVMTTYSWQPNGDMVHSGLITVIKDGKPVVLSTVST